MQRIRKNGCVLLGVGILIGILIARSSVEFESSVEAARGKVKSVTACRVDSYRA